MGGTVKKREQVSKTILGIDPGTNYTGYGVVRVTDGKPECVVLGYIELVRYKDPYRKLHIIFDRVSSIISEFRPDEVAFESPFFGENVQSMLKLGRAQGVAMAATLTHGLPVYEYAPRKIKQTITGNGAASKEQVASMLKSMLKVDYTLKKLDATDGLAVALCHHFESSSLMNRVAGTEKKNALGGGILAASRKGSQSWESFIRQNPEREARAGKGQTVKAGKSKK